MQQDASAALSHLLAAIRLLRPILDVLLQQPILKIRILDRAPCDVVKRKDADQFAVIHDRHVREIHFGHQAA